MIFICVKWTIRPERSGEWISLVADYTQAVRAEPGNLSFEWSRSVENPHQFVLVEMFADRKAGEEHVNSEHFRTAMSWMPEVVAEKPQIVNVELPGDGWSEMAEITPTRSDGPA
jgi:quinol monooxygenase YgiN